MSTKSLKKNPKKIDVFVTFVKLRKIKVRGSVNQPN